MIVGICVGSVCIMLRRLLWIIFILWDFEGFGSSILIMDGVFIFFIVFVREISVGV